VSTSCLLALLCIAYPRALVVFVSLLMLDIFSHWFQMYSTLLAGSSTHKVGQRSSMHLQCWP
jgi:CDP-diacylglycerol--inositol 3-phosphatidyltransferase